MTTRLSIAEILLL